jgi:hypothetical protein
MPNPLDPMRVLAHIVEPRHADTGWFGGNLLVSDLRAVSLSRVMSAGVGAFLIGYWCGGGWARGHVLPEGSMSQDVQRVSSSTPWPPGLDWVAHTSDASAERAALHSRHDRA